MESREEDIKELKASIKEREVVRDRLSVDHKSFDALTKEITEKQETLNIYLKSQQGKFASPISVVLSHSYW